MLSLKREKCKSLSALHLDIYSKWKYIDVVQLAVAKSIQLNSAIEIRLMCNVYTVIYKYMCIFFLPKQGRQPWVADCRHFIVIFC